jgi:hypothetical protein
VELTNYQSNDCKFDHFTLEYLGQGSATGISNLTSGQENRLNEEYFDLQGRRLSHPGKGINIRNGQMMIVRD